MTETILNWIQMNWTVGEVLSFTVDFILLYIVVYGVLYFLRGTKTVNVLIGLVMIFLLFKVLADSLGLKVASTLLVQLSSIFGFAILVMFQPEIRRFFAEAGGIISSAGSTDQNTATRAINEVANALVELSDKKTGALIVFEGSIGLNSWMTSSHACRTLDAQMDSHLLQTIFYKGTPLHDNAVIVRNFRIAAAHVQLPLKETTEYTNLGTRHHAALGISDESDAIAVVVSEENGIISIARKGRLKRYNDDRLWFKHTASAKKEQVQRLSAVLESLLCKKQSTSKLLQAAGN